MSSWHKINYPYPVLQSECRDYKKGQFRTEIKVDSDYVVNVKCQIVNNITLKKLVEQEHKAAYVTEFSCSGTYANWAVKSFTPEFPPIPLIPGKVKNVVNIQTYAIMLDGLKNYSSKDFVDDYDDLDFSFLPGDIIAVGDAKKINIIYDTEVVHWGDSIVYFKDAGKEDVLHVDLSDNNYIYVYMPTNIFKIYRDYGKKHIPLTHAILTTKAIQQALSSLYLNDENDEKRWGKSIRQKMLQLYGSEKDCKVAVEKNAAGVSEQLFDNIYAKVLEGLVSQP